MNFLVLFIICLIVGCSSPKENLQEKYLNVQAGNVRLKIPEKYLSSSLKDSLKSSTSNSNGIKINIPLKDVAQASLAAADSEVILTGYLLKKDVDRKGIPVVTINAWNRVATNEYAVTLDEKLNLYKVEGAGKDSIWTHYFKIMPDSAILKISNWMASCAAIAKQGNSCLKSYTFQELQVDIYFSERYVSLISENKSNIIELFKSWIKKS